MNNKALIMRTLVFVAVIVLTVSSYAMAIPAVSIINSDTYGSVGSTFWVDIELDNTASTVSMYSFGIQYDNVELDFIQLSESTPNELTWDFWMTYNVNEAVGRIEHINAAAMSGYAPAGGFTVASMQFKILSYSPDLAGPAQVDIVFYEEAPVDGWMDSKNQIFDVNYKGGDVNPIVPEPISSTLFIVGAATLGFRRFRKSKV